MTFQPYTLVYLVPLQNFCSLLKASQYRFLQTQHQKLPQTGVRQHLDLTRLQLLLEASEEVPTMYLVSPINNTKNVQSKKMGDWYLL